MRALTHNPAAKQTPAAEAANEAVAAVELARSFQGPRRLSFSPPASRRSRLDCCQS